MDQYQYPEYQPAPKFFCSECGRLRCQRDVPKDKVCRFCKAKADKLRVPDIPIQLTEGLEVTKTVKKRLRNCAEREMPPNILEKICDKAMVGVSIPLSLSPFYIIANHTGPGLASHQLGHLLEVLVAFALIEFVLYLPSMARNKRIDGRVLELAEHRKQVYEEALRFYSSPEWIALRKRVIKEEGRVCAECGTRIKSEADLTVDHKKPRSKYRELALERNNLRVLCRSCNSSKGAKEFDFEADESGLE